MSGFLAWVRPRRWSILAEAALAVLLAVIALPVLAFGGQGPVDIVTDYLEALRDGDIEAAREHISEPDMTFDTTWLTAEALSSDWEIASVVQPTRSDATVHAEITARGQSAEAAFYLTRSEGETLIANPYFFISVSPQVTSEAVFGLSEIELNGLSAEPPLSEELGIGQIALFPGAYTIGESNDLLSDPEPPMLLAAPEHGFNTAHPLEAVLADHLVGNDAVEEQLNADLAAWIDHCAEQAEPAPAGCPFSATADFGDITDGDLSYTNPRDLTWEVDAYPRLRFTDLSTYDARHYMAETVEPGRVHLTATAVEIYSDEERPYSAYCAINLAELEPVLLPGGQFEFHYPVEPWADCRPA